MISYRQWVLENYEKNELPPEHLQLMLYGWNAALEAVLNEKKSTRYVMPDTEEHRLLAEKLADTEDGQIIPLTSLELSLLIDIETIGG